MRINIIIQFLIFLLVGCTVSSRVEKNKLISIKNQDVYILSQIIQREFQTKAGRNISISEIYKLDTLKRIQNRFEKVELKLKGGFISVKFKYSDSNISINNKLIGDGNVDINQIKWVLSKKVDEYDGEIRFDYGERDYRIKKIIICNRKIF